MLAHDRQYIKDRLTISVALERVFITLLNARRRRTMPGASEVKSVLVVRHNQLGDAVAASSFIAAIHDIWPGVEVDVLAGKDNVEAFSWVHGIRKVYLRPHDASLRKRLAFYKSFAGRYDIVFQTLLDESYMRRSLAARMMAGPGLVVGRARGSPMEEVYDLPVFVPRGSYVGKLMTLLAPFTSVTAAELLRRHPRHLLTLPAASTEAALTRLAFLGLKPGGFIAMNISARAKFRELGVEQAARLAKALIERGCPVLLLYSPADLNRAKQVQQLAPAVHLSDTKSLPEAMALAQSARLYFGADTGTAHFAAAGQVPCMVLFSYQARADIWSPYGVPFVSVQANPDQQVSELDDGVIMAFTDRLLAGERLTCIVKSTPDGYPI